ncbi:hypothetical protein [Pantoea sp. USHLN298]
MAPCLLFQTVNKVKAMGEYAWSKALRRRDKTPGVGPDAGLSALSNNMH